jgi:aspartyl-tRNA synthetase
MSFVDRKFNMHEMPTAFFWDNSTSTELRNELIKNQVRISECEQGDLETYFFSNENIDLINKQLILSVFKKTNGEFKISNQKNEDLIIVMRYTFIEYAKHLPYDIRNQIKELNTIVVGQILPNVITQITQRKEYLRVISAPREILPLPISESTSNRILPSVTKTF